MKGKIRSSWIATVLPLLAVLLLPAVSRAGSRVVTSLPNLSVRSFAQDGSGFMWIATDNGLCRYSGHDYLYFFNEPDTEGTLPSDKVRKLAVDGNDVLWVLTDKGLCYYDRLLDSFRGVALPFAVDGLLVRGDGIVCYGGNGTVVVDASEAKVVRTLTEPGHRLSSMIADSAGNIWGCLADSLTVTRYSPDLEESGSVSLPVHSSFRTMAFDCRGRLWTGRENGLSVIDTSLMSPLVPPDAALCIEAVRGNEVSVMLPVGSTMYFCMPGVGIYTLDMQNGQFRKDIAKRFSLSDVSDFCCACLDSENHPWIGTLDRGFGVRFLEKKNFSLSSGLSRNTVGRYINGMTVSHRSGLVLMASYYKGLVFYDIGRSGNKWLSYGKDPVLSSIGKMGIRTLMCDSRDRLWLNMEGKVAVCSFSKTGLRSGHIVCRDMEVNRFVEDGDAVWFCTEEGLVLWRDGKVGARLFQEYEVLDALVMEEGKLLVAVDNSGLFEVDTRDLSFRQSPLVGEELKPLLQNPSVLHLCGGDLWVGTHSRGLFGFCEGGQVRRYDSSNGLGSNDISGIENDIEGNIFVSTTYGLSVITEKFPGPVTYYQGRWMDTQQFCPRSSAAYGNKLFFGGNTGCAYFESDRIISNISDAPVNVVLTELSVNGEVMTPGRGGVLEKLINDTDRIVLKSSQNTVGLRFDYVSFIAEENVNFFYSLTQKGTPSDWIDIGRHKSVNFSHLPSGHYVFELASTNFDGFLSREPRRLEIIVRKSPWISWYSILIYVLVVSLTVLAVVRFVMQRKVRAAELQVMKEELERVTSLFRSSVDSHQNALTGIESGSENSGQEDRWQALPEADREFINSVTDYIVTHMTGAPISIESLSEEMCMSRASFFRKMKSLTGMTPNDFILSYRLDKAASMLKEGRWRVNEISDMLGFSSQSHFSKVFKNKFGVPPKDWH